MYDFFPINDPVRDPINDPINDPVRDPINDPVRCPVPDPADLLAALPAGPSKESFAGRSYILFPLDWIPLLGALPRHLVFAALVLLSARLTGEEIPLAGCAEEAGTLVGQYRVVLVGMLGLIDRMAAAYGRRAERMANCRKAKEEAAERENGGRPAARSGYDGGGRQPKKEPERAGSFDPEEMMQRALERAHRESAVRMAAAEKARSEGERAAEENRRA